MQYFSEVLANHDNVQLLLVAIAAVASAITPYMANKFRERRAKKPRTPQEKLYAYYESYIERLEKQLEKKDYLIEKLYKQITDQRIAFERTIHDLEQKVKEQLGLLDSNQREIEKLRTEISGMQSNHLQAHRDIEELKSQVPTLDK